MTATALQPVRASIDKISAEPNTDAIKKQLSSLGNRRDEISSRVSTLVKGRKIGSMSEDDQAYMAERLFKSAIEQGKDHPEQVLKSLSPAFGNALTLAMQNSPQVYAMNQFVAQLNEQLSAQLGKSITLTSPNSTGLVPYDLNGVLAS